MLGLLAPRFALFIAAKWQTGGEAAEKTPRTSTAEHTRQEEECRSKSAISVYKS